MGSLPTNMKASASLLVLAGVALGRELLPEEHWRPSQGRDLSKFKPRHAKYGIEGEVGKEEDVVKNIVKKINTPDPFVGEKRNFDDICGIENDGHDPRGKIVGGFEAEEHEWPWIVALFIDDMWFCGGALISDELSLQQPIVPKMLPDLISWLVLTMLELTQNQKELRFLPTMGGLILIGTLTHL